MIKVERTYFPQNIGYLSEWKPAEWIAGLPWAERLVHWSAEGGDVPNLAESWDMDVDKKPSFSSWLRASNLLTAPLLMLKERNYMPAFTISQMGKDFNIALSTGNTANAAMPLTSIVRQFFGTMMAKGRGEQDFFGLVALL